MATAVQRTAARMRQASLSTSQTQGPRGQPVRANLPVIPIALAAGGAALGIPLVAPGAVPDPIPSISRDVAVVGIFLIGTALLVWLARG